MIHTYIFRRQYFNYFVCRYLYIIMCIIMISHNFKEAVILTTYRIDTTEDTTMLLMIHNLFCAIAYKMYLTFSIIIYIFLSYIFFFILSIVIYIK